MLAFLGILNDGQPSLASKQRAEPLCPGKSVDIHVHVMETPSWAHVPKLTAILGTEKVLVQQNNSM
jgi:hypothetical protein